MLSHASWTNDIDNLLNNIRINCLFLCKAHKKRYFTNKDRLIWYRLPVIVLNGANSIISVGLQPYADQGIISLTTSLIALSCGIVGSIELYLGIQKKLESDLISQRDYYLLSVDIYKTLSLKSENRPIPAKDFLEKTYNIYTKLIESSETLLKKIDDKLIPVCLIACEKVPKNGSGNGSENDTENDNDNDNDHEFVVLTPHSSGSVEVNIPNGVRELSIDD
jgi:hypothetical protein